jgi:hypothetical protein
VDARTARMAESPRRREQAPGEVLLRHNLAREAIPHLIRSAAAEPSAWRHFVNLGIAYRKTCQYDESRMALMRASVLKPDAWQVFHTWAQLLDEEGRFEECLEARWKAWELCGQKNQDAAMGLAWSLMRLGRWQEAWPFWEAGRFMRCWYPPPGLEPWQGENLKGKKLLILPEGGYGDAFMFGRWIPELEAEGAEVSIHIWDSAVELLRSSPQLRATKFIPLSGPINTGEFDYVTTLMSIPAVLGVPFDEVPPTLRFDVPWTMRGPERRIGICWKAEEAGSHRRFRSIPDAEAERFLEMEGKLFSLVPGSEIGRMTPSQKVWVGTASVIKSLDVVISVDTAAAHLAGCLGIPTVLILPMHSSWQWGVEGKSAPWYRCLKIVRSKHPDDWREPVREAIEIARRM